MKTNRILVGTLILGLLLALVAALGLPLPQGAAHAQDPDPRPAPEEITAPHAQVGTSFTYQGWLTDGGSPAEGEYDLRFRLYDAATGGALLGTDTFPNHPVSAGLFTVHLDFGEVFTGTARYLKIAVRPGGSDGAYTPLAPRQELTPAPYALALPGLWTQQNATSPNLIGGYAGNWVAGGIIAATIGGGGEAGFPNRVTASYGTVAGGLNNEAGGSAATVGGGFSNGIGDFGEYATIGGGRWNTADGKTATVGGGQGNTANGPGATVGGGSSNTAGAHDATIGGGYDNLITSTASSATIGGGTDNAIENYSRYATIGGGRYNQIGDYSYYATMGGGYNNDIGDNSDRANIGGGGNNDIGDHSPDATIGGGGANGIGEWGEKTTIGGGAYNDTGNHGGFATIGGGYDNDIGDMSFYATIGGGYGNDVGDSSSFATIPGGYLNEASGDYAFAAGQRAKALHDGSFVFADSNDFDFGTSVPNSFKARATGGVRFVLGINASGGTTWSCLVNDGDSWSCSSDRNLKENLRPVDGGEVLRRLQEVPIYTWNGKGQDPAAPHMGPMAQDFFAAFGLGDNDTHISTIDLDGVALAGIHELDARNQELAAQVSAYKAENTALQAENTAQQAQIDDLEARLTGLERGSASPSPASGLPTWLLLGGLVLVGGVVLRQSLRD